MSLKNISAIGAKSVLHLPSGGSIDIGHYGHNIPNALSTLGIDGLIIEGLWGFNDLGAHFGSEIVDLLGVSEVMIRNICYEIIQKNQQITVIALHSTNHTSPLKSVAFVPTEAFSCCERFRDTKYGLPCKDFYYNITYEALELLIKNGCSRVAIANITGYTYYHKNIGNCVAEAITHFAINNPTLQSVFSIGRGPDLTYGINFFNENPDLIGQHRQTVREVTIENEFASTIITLPNQLIGFDRKIAKNSYLVQASIRKAADDDNADAQCLLGDEYSEYGNKWEAVKWYLKAAYQDHPDAQFKLGQMYDDLDQPEDFAEALKWYRKAAENGHVDAQFALGRIYTNGDEVVENFVEAVKWFRMAAEQGSTGAQHDLGRMYEEGLGVKRNIVQALKWFSLSTASQDPSAIADRDSVTKEMTQSQIATALTLVQKWTRK